MSALDMLDFNRSFLTFTTRDHGNTARIQIEARCTLVAPSSERHRYVLIAACKAEDTYGHGPLFKQPNYDFSGVFSERDYAIYRLFALAEDNQPESGPIEQLFASVEINATPLARPRALNRVTDIVDAVLAGVPLAARTEFDVGGAGYHATLDYPLKTINVNHDLGLFQVDTGPLPWPHMEHDTQALVDGFAPAFIAYKSFDKAEFIIQQPTTVAGVEWRVNHYSATTTVDARTTIIAAD